MHLERNLDIRVGRQSAQKCPNGCPHDRNNAITEKDGSVEINESFSATLRDTLVVRSHIRITIRSKPHEHRSSYQNEDGHTLH